MGVPRIIADRFDVERLAGAGGMGCVYQAVDRISGARVAVKVLRAESFESARFEREGALLAELGHPGIVRYVGHGSTDDGERWLAMEWLLGEDLGQRLKRAELDLDETLAVALGAAEALGAAHRQGVVHRDVKPGNLFLDGGDARRVRLLDFGIARAPRAPVALTRTGFMIGTPGYMAPEQIRGEKGIDARADVFSLGCVMFRCLAGRPPFIGDDVLGMLLKVTLEAAPRLRDLRPEIRGELDDLVDRMLARDRDARPRDGAAVADEIARMLHAGAGHLSFRPPPPVGEEERRLRCVLCARAATGTSLGAFGASEHDLFALADRYGGALHVLVDGSLVVTLAGQDGAATDQAVRAARCALAFHALLPGVPLALFADRRVVTTATRGDADRTAALLARGSDGGVPIDEIIAALLDPRFDVREIEGGRALVGERDLDEATRVLLGRPTAFVGRDAEIGRLLSYIDESASEHVARAILVTAPAGAGKSRLKHELVRRVRAERPDVELWEGRGDPMSAGSPFAMLGAVVRRAAGVRAGDPPALRQQQLAARVGRHLALADRAREAAFVGEIAGISGDDAAPELRAARADPRLLGDRMMSSWLAFLRAETAAAPVCVVLEDMHWGDAPSLGFVGAALRDLAERPLVVIALARPEVHDAFPGLWADRSLVEVKLGPLSRRAVERLARGALGDDAAPAVIDAIVARAGGNAFYAEELIRAVAEGRGDTWPDTVLAMAEQRLDRLDPEARRVLRAASVFGATFWTRGVEALLPGAARASDRLAELAAREVIERRGEQRFPGEEAYSFRHALMRDAAYATLPEADRAAAHGLAAAWLERAGEGDALLLAEHFERGGAPDRARGFYRRAAEQALEGDDMPGAIARAERAILCGATGEELGAIRVIQGEAHAWRGETPLAERCAIDAMEVLPRGGALWCQAAGVAVMTHLQLGHLDRFTSLARALFQIEPTPDAVDRYALGSALVMAYLWTGGLYDMARAFMARTRAVIAPALASHPIGRGWIGWAECCAIKYDAGDPWRALRAADAAIASFDEAGDVRGGMRVRMERGVALRHLGLWADAEATFRATLADSRRLGVRFLEAGSQLQLGMVLSGLGRGDEGRAEAARAVSLYEEMGNAMLAAAARAMLAAIDLDRGDTEAAAIGAAASAEVLVAPPARAAALGVVAAAKLARGDVEGALAASTEAMRIVTQLGAIPEGDAGLRLVHAEALAAAGRVEDAARAIEAARARLHARGDEIGDPAAKRSFFEAVPVNRRTMAG